MPFEIEFVFEGHTALFTRQTRVLLHVQCEMTFERELFLAMMAVIDRVDAIRSEVSTAVNTRTN